MKVDLEIIIASFDSAYSLRYFIMREDISKSTDDPDQLVRKIIQDSSGSHPAFPWNQCIVHSTSWRYEGNQSLVLTYLVYSDYVMINHDSWKRLNLLESDVSLSQSLTKPRPLQIEESHIVSHGIRHLAYLVKRNKEMCNVLSFESVNYFKELSGMVAGRIF